MKYSVRLLSLVLVILMMSVAAIVVNKYIFGHNIETSISEERNKVSSDSISFLDDNTVVINTSSLPGTENGYAGAVPLEIKITDGKISEINVLQNNETPGFLKRTLPLLDSWKGKTPEEALESKVDAVTGATYSSNAIISNLNAGIRCYLGSKENNPTETPMKIWVAFLVTLAACIIPLFSRNKTYHYIQLLANVIVLGFWTGQFLDYSLMLKYLSFGFTWPEILVGAAMLTAAFIFPLFGRSQHYCNHICPLGSAQILVSQLCGYKIKLSSKVLNGLDWFRRILWAVLMLLLWTDCLTDWMDLELFQAFLFRSASWWIIGIAILFVLVSSIISRPYCRFVCPTGSLFKRAENFG